MSDYEILNLRDVENVAPRFGMPDGMEARFAKRDLGSQEAGVSLQKLGPNLRAPFGHRHADQEEVYVVVAGGGRVNLGGDVRDVRAWDAVRVAPGVMRAFEAGPDGLELLAFGASDAPENDAQIEPGWWEGDAG